MKYSQDFLTPVPFARSYITRFSIEASHTSCSMSDSDDSDYSYDYGIAGAPGWWAAMAHFGGGRRHIQEQPMPGILLLVWFLACGFVLPMAALHVLGFAEDFGTVGVMAWLSILVATWLVFSGTTAAIVQGSGMPEFWWTIQNRALTDRELLTICLVMGVGLPLAIGCAVDGSISMEAIVGWVIQSLCIAVAASGRFDLWRTRLLDTQATVRRQRWHRACCHPRARSLWCFRTRTIRAPDGSETVVAESPGKVLVVVLVVFLLLPTAFIAWYRQSMDVGFPLDNNDAAAIRYESAQQITGLQIFLAFGFILMHTTSWITGYLQSAARWLRSKVKKDAHWLLVAVLSTCAWLYFQQPPTCNKTSKYNDDCGSTSPLPWITGALGWVYWLCWCCAQGRSDADHETAVNQAWQWKQPVRLSTLAAQQRQHYLTALPSYSSATRPHAAFLPEDDHVRAQNANVWQIRPVAATDTMHAYTALVRVQLVSMANPIYLGRPVPQALHVAGETHRLSDASDRQVEQLLWFDRAGGFLKSESENQWLCSHVGSSDGRLRVHSRPYAQDMTWSIEPV